MKNIRRFAICFTGVLLLTGCQQMKDNLGINHSSNQKGSMTVLAMGQSNIAGTYYDPRPLLMNDFVSVMADKGIAITVKNVAVGGSTLNQWMPGSVNYKNAVKTSYGVHIDAIVFWQGENDTEDLTLAQTWGSRFETMIAQLRADIHEPSVPVYYFRIDNFNCLPYWNVVRDQQTQVRIPYGTLVSIDDIPFSLSAGCVHLAEDGYTLAARRLAAVMTD